MNVSVSVADIIARAAVLEAIESAEARFIDREHRATEEGRYAEAQGAHEYVKWCHRAWEAEFNDPQPKGPK